MRLRVPSADLRWSWEGKSGFKSTHDQVAGLLLDIGVRILQVLLLLIDALC